MNGPTQKAVDLLLPIPSKNGSTGIFQMSELEWNLSSSTQPAQVSIGLRAIRMRKTL